MPIFVGSLVAPVPPFAVAVLIVFGLAAAWLAQHASRLGQLVLSLGVPMVGVGLSYVDHAEAAGLALIMIGGSLYACAVSMLWPESVAPPRPPAQVAPTLFYGLCLGLAGATAAAIGFGFDFDHVGWAATAAMLVMRPAREMQQLRSVGRLISVVAGAIIGIGIARLEPPAAVYSLVILALVAVVAATNRSRWYVTPAFTTCLVFLLLVQSNPSSAASRFGECVSETVLGVGLAYIVGLAMPDLLRRRRTSTTTRSAGSLPGRRGHSGSGIRGGDAVKPILPLTERYLGVKIPPTNLQPDDDTAASAFAEKLVNQLSSESPRP